MQIADCQSAKCLTASFFLYFWGSGFGLKWQCPIVERFLCVVNVHLRFGSYIVLSFGSQSLHQVGPEDDSAGFGLPLLVFRRPGLWSIG